MRLVVVLVTIAMALTGCERTPTGRNQLALVPESVMANLGERTFARMTRERAVADPTGGRSGWVSCIGRAVIDAAARVYPDADMPKDWEIAVFEANSPNAFALPGGRIGVHTGMLELTQSPAQLAAVLGHEVAHVLADHGNERLTQELGMSAVLYLVGLFAEGEVDADMLLAVLGVGARLGVALPFSRVHEREADRMGVKIMAEAGFDPRASVALWRNMARRSDGQPPEFLSTHPAHETRIEELQSQMDAARARFVNAAPAACGR